MTHYEIGEILEGAEGVGPPMPPWVAAALVRIAGAMKHVPGLRVLLERTPARGLLELHRVHDLFRRMNCSNKIFIAAINGPATGGGCEIALACDVRYMADSDSLRIGLPEMTIGLPPGAGGSQRLARALGASRALEMMLEGRTLTPAEALSVGLVHRLAPAASLRGMAIEAAHRLARRSPEAVRALKRSVYEGSAGALEKGLATERKLFLWAGGRCLRVAECGPSRPRSSAKVARRGPTPKSFAPGKMAKCWISAACPRGRRHGSDRRSKFINPGAPSDESPSFDGFFVWVEAIRRRFAGAPGWLSAPAREPRRPRRGLAFQAPSRSQVATERISRQWGPLRRQRADAHDRLVE